MAMRWRFVDHKASSAALGENTDFDTVEINGVALRTVRFPNGVFSECYFHWQEDPEYAQAYLRPEFKIVFTTANGVATGLADWHMKDIDHVDGELIANPAHDYKLPHAVGAAGNRVWITPWTIELSVILYRFGGWQVFRVQRDTTLDTIADDLLLISTSFRYRTIA
jgi:hypothetical protein